MTTAAPPEVPDDPPFGTVACPRCGEWLAPDQDWCLRCGDPARTVIAPSPRWRRPLLTLLAIAVLALGALAAAFVALTDDDPPPARTLTRTITTQPGDTLPPGVIPAPTGPSGVTGATGDTGVTGATGADDALTGATGPTG